MDYYIDFDNTLYETKRLTQNVLSTIASIISNKSGQNADEILEMLKAQFNSGKDNMYAFSKKIADQYNIDDNMLVDSIKNIVNRGEEFVYSDVKEFLKRLKETGNRIILFTYLPKTNQEYQLQKINGSSLAEYFDIMIFTTESKHTLDLNYQNGVFIDDNPEVLEGLSSVRPSRLIRIKRENNKYSKVEMNLENMEEYKQLSDIPLDFNK